MIILCGIKHCGKSTIGRKVSELYKIPFVDVDVVIEKIAGKSCRDLYRQDGKDAFMKAEAEACYEIVNDKSIENAIIATGGGICDNQIALNYLLNYENAKLFYINIDEEIAFERIQRNMEKTGSWPAWISKDIYEDLEKIKNQFHNFYLERTEKYKKLCSEIIEVENGNSEKAVKFFSVYFDK